MDNVYSIAAIDGQRFYDIRTFPGNLNQAYKQAHANGIPMIMPVRLKLESWGDWWTIPIEPLVSVSGGNVVSRRTVAKGKHRGTIKERWTQDDYNIIIRGVLINHENESKFPEADLQKLRQVCEAAEAVQVECDMLQYFDIYRAVVLKYNFPFTHGEMNQTYQITLVSDDLTDILTEEDQL